MDAFKPKFWEEPPEIVVKAVADKRRRKQAMTVAHAALPSVLVATVQATNLPGNAKAMAEFAADLCFRAALAIIEKSEAIE